LENEIAIGPSAHLLLLYALLAVVGLIVLIARFKVNSFVALILASLFVGLTSGMNLAEIGAGFQNGVGKVLGSIAMIVGLGTLLGKMLAESGGAEVVAHTLIRLMGTKRLKWAMMFVAFVVGLPVWFAVGLVLLVPILYTVARETRTPLLLLGIPLAAGLSVTHGLVPPHPGPMVAVAALNANIGLTILYSVIVGLPTAIIAGPLCARWLAGREQIDLSGGTAAQLLPKAPPKNPPGFGLTVFTILLPIALMLLATVADVTLTKDSTLRQWADFGGHPLVAMTVAFLFSCWSFGVARGFDKEQILKFTNECVGPVASTLLIVGAGGGFNGILVASGVGDAIAAMVKDTPVSPLILGWFAAALIRIATGSATVAITTAAGILAPIVAARPDTNLELLVISMGAGSLILSHVNDGGFWFVKEYFNLTVTQTLKTWTVMETIIAVIALGFVLLLAAVV
jgi:gluconate:H+ symporter, GntP family